MVFKSILLLCLLLVSGLAAAQQTGGVFRWVDKDGQVHYTKALPPEYANLPYERLNDAGLVVERFEGTKSAEEMAVEAAEAQRLIDEKAEQERLDRENRALLVKFPTLEDLDKSLEFNLERISSDISIAQTMFDTQVQSLALEVRRAADLQRAGGRVNGALRQNVRTLQLEITSHQQKINELEVSLETVRRTYEQNRTRYLGIKEN
jgi:hypothetical protein